MGDASFGVMAFMGSAGSGIGPAIGVWVWKQDARQSNGLVQWDEDAGQSNGSVQPSFIVGQVEFWGVPVLGNASFG